MLKDKCVVVGVTGGIAAYKTASLSQRFSRRSVQMCT